MVSFPYYSHTTQIRIPKDMGIVWETYHKGVPLLGVPENALETTSKFTQLDPPKSPPRMLILGRVVAGVGVGITSAAGPAFISAT